MAKKKYWGETHRSHLAIVSFMLYLCSREPPKQSNGEIKHISNKIKRSTAAELQTKIILFVRFNEWRTCIPAGRQLNFAEARPTTASWAIYELQPNSVGKLEIAWSFWYGTEIFEFRSIFGCVLVMVRCCLPLFMCVVWHWCLACCLVRYSTHWAEGSK